MKHFTKLALSVVILVTTFVFAEDVEQPSFASRYSFKEGLAVTQQHQRPLILFFWNTYCVACEALRREVLSHPDVLRYLDEHFVVSWVDTLNKANREVLEQYNVRGTPTIVFTAILTAALEAESATEMQSVVVQNTETQVDYPVTLKRLHSSTVEDMLLLLEEIVEGCTKDCEVASLP